MLIPLETAAEFLFPPLSLSQYCLSYALVCNICRLRVVVVFCTNTHFPAVHQKTSGLARLSPTHRRQVLEDAGFRMQSVGLLMQIRGGLLCRGDLKSSCGKNEHVFYLKFV